MTDVDLHKAIEVMKSHGYEVVMPGLVTHTRSEREQLGEFARGSTIEAPATDAQAMEQALAQTIPGGDLSMASHAGLANAVGQLSHRVVLLEEGIQRLAHVLLGDSAAAAERPEKVESEPEPIGPNTTDPQTKCTCGHSRLSHNGSKYACGHGRGTSRPCDCDLFVEDPGLIGHHRVERGPDDLPTEV